jgi:hypothetical protein
MKLRFLFPTLLAVTLLTRGFSAEEPSPQPTPTPVPPAPEQTNMKEALRAELAEDAKKTPAKPTRPPAVKGNVTTAAPTKSAPAPFGSTAPSSLASPSPSPTPALKDNAEQAKDNSVTMMPKVVVQKQRITEVDRAVHAKDLEIEKEQEKTRATDTDKALNSSKISGGVMSIFGGRSAEVGEGLAAQRVSLLEIERDLVAEIALAKTKEEKADLQKQLDEIKAMRRDLEKPR